MINLATSDVIRVVTSAAATVSCYAAWGDLSGTTVTLGRTPTLIITAATTTIVPGPAAATVRNVKSLVLSNTHASLTCVVTVEQFDGANVQRMIRFTLLAGESAVMIEDGRWFHRDSAGSDYPAAAAAWGSITGTLANQTDLQAALDAKQPLDADLTTIAGLVATTDNFIQSKASAWASRTPAQVKVDLNLTGTNSGDQTITLTGPVTGTGTGTFATTIAAGVVTLANQADMATASVVYRKTAAAGPPEVQTLATLKTDLGLTGTNSGDQTSIVGITGTLAEFNTALTGADFATGGGTATGANTGDQTITLTGPVTGTGTGSFATTIAAGVVTLANQANIATSSIMGRVTAAAGVQEVLTPAQVRTLINVADGANNYVHPNHSGDVTSVADGATTIVADAVTNAKLANMATSTFKGRATAGTGDPEDLTSTQATALLDLATLTAKGIGPARSGVATEYLSGTGVYSVPAGGGDMVLASVQTNSGLKTFLDATFGLRNVANTFTALFTNTITAARTYTLKDASGTIAFTSDITGTNSGTNTGDQTITLTSDVTGTGTGSFATTIAADAVTNAKLANVNTQTFKGRITAAAGDPEDLTAAQATTIIDTFTSALKGLAPPSSGGTTNFLRADGTWAAPGGGGSTDTGLVMALIQNAYLF